MHKYSQQTFTGERALFMESSAEVELCTFMSGESPLKECRNIEITGSLFKWKYPLWYCRDIRVTNSVLSDTARAGIWYTDDIQITDTSIDAPKTFRRSKNIKLTNVAMPNALETLHFCDGVIMKDVTARGDYFAKNCADITADNLTLTGNYGFDGCKNVRVVNSKLLSKDAFWNCEDVVVENSLISGEYIAWNSKNVTLLNCTVESLQGFCYIDNLVLKNCRLLNTTLAFEYCTVDAHVTTEIESVKNPISGTIRAKDIGEIIFDDPAIDRARTSIELSGHCKCLKMKKVG
jgi:hypothetical protein